MRARVGVILFGVCFLSCVNPPSVYPPTAPSLVTFSTRSPRPVVFDAALRAAIELNLVVAVLEKDSGFIRFERASLSPAQLDGYCVYPAVDAKNQQPVDTFTNWDVRSFEAGAGNVQGSVSLTLLLSESEGGGTSGTIRGVWTVWNANEK